MRTTFIPLKHLGLLLTVVVAFVISGCSNDNSPLVLTCATYTVPAAGDTAAVTRSGTITDANCVYATSFVDLTTPLTQDITLLALPNSGAHIFQGSLVVGASSTTADLTTAMITEGGDGVKLTVDAGAIVAFMDSSDVLLVNRGAQIIASGASDNPVTFTSNEDVAGNVGSTIAGNWGGIIINGFGIVNTCAYTATTGGGAGTRTFGTDANAYSIATTSPALTSTNCDQANGILGDAGAVTAITGDAASNYGGTRSADNSGTLSYVVIKHAGGAVTGTIRPAALTLAAVGSGTTVNNVQVFSTRANGVALNGGAVSISNLMVYNARNNGVAVANGYLGTLERVLVSQADDTGGRCISVNGTATSANAGTVISANIATVVTSGLHTKVLVNRLTCDVSPTEPDAPILAGSGLFLGAGAELAVQNALVVASKLAAADTPPDDNVCLAGTNLVAGQTQGTFTAAVFSCPEPGLTLPSTQLTETRTLFADAGDPVATVDTGLQILTSAGTTDARPIFSLLQAESMVTVTTSGTAAVVPVADYSPEGADITFLGAISVGSGNNPFSGWTFGVFE